MNFGAMSLAAIVALSCTYACSEEWSPPAGARVELISQSFQYASVGQHDHGDFTRSALSFLKPEIANEIADENEGADKSELLQKLSQCHFDNCRLAEGFAWMEALLENTVGAFNPAGPNGVQATASFGLLTHAAQDFYAHSNWVEAGKTGLYARDEWDFPRGASGDLLQGLVVLRVGMADGSTLSRAAGSRVPLIISRGVSFSGLMTGTYNNDDPSVCPPSVAIAHGFSIGPDFWGPYDGFLAKDWRLSSHHQEASALAKAQTTEEFCRLDRVVGLRYGLAGQSLFRSAWIADMQGFNQACPNNQKLIASLFVTL